MSRLTKKCIDTDGKYLPYTIDNYCGVYPESTLGKLVERLAYYEDLEEQGRLVELPYKIGANVSGKYRNWSGTIDEISINSDGIFLYINSGYSFYVRPDEIK